MSKNSKIIYFFLTSLFFCESFFAFGNFILANEVDYIVISEILVTGDPTTYDFIELYNPTNMAINLKGYRLVKRTADATTDTPIKSWTSDAFIPAYGFYLWANSSYEISPAADITTAASIASHGGIALRHGAENTGKIVDSVAWGMVAIDHVFKEGKMTVNPAKSQSLEREIVDGIIQDTDNNYNDFVLQASPNPQNSSSATEQPDFASDGAAGNGSDSLQDDSSQETGANEDSESLEDSESDDSQDDDDEQEQDGSTALRDNGAVDVIITEFLPDPEDSDRDNEFIEIYNDGDAEVNLSGWTLEDKMGSIKKFVISDGVEISAGKYKAFYSDETGIALNNSGDGVILRDNKGDFVDETQTSGAALEEQAFALDENKNWVWTLRPTPERENIIKAEKKIILDSESSENLADEDNDNDEQDGSTALRDYGANDSNDSSYDFSDKIIISEIYPNSEGRDNRNGSYEWIELYNDSNREVNLNGWMIDDILEKGSKAYIIGNEIIKAGSYKIFDAAYTKIALNNTGDEVNLLWPDGVVVDKIKYEKADEGLSYNLSNSGDWFWSSLITPEEENRNLNFSGSSIAEYNVQDYLDDEYFEDEEFENGYGDGENLNPDYVEAKLEDIEYFTKHTRIKVSGIVSTPPGIFSDQTFYISGSGIQVYSYEAKIPDLNVGDEVEIIGEISEIGGEKRILIDRSEDIKIISSDNLVESKIVSTGDVNEAFEGYLMTVEGKVSQIKSDVFFLDDGSGEIKIYLKPQARIKRPEIEIGDWMVITGQVSQTSAGYRILPRFQGDLRLSRVTGAAQVADISTIQENIEDNEEENKNGNFVFYGIMMIVGILILVDWVRIRKVRNRK